MKQIFTISNQLIALGKRLAMVLTMLLMLGIGQAWGMDSNYTIGEKVTTLSDGDYVAWGTSTSQLAKSISSNWVYLSDTKSEWIVFKVVKQSNNFYLQNVADNKYVYSSADKKVAFDNSNKTAITLTKDYYVYGGSSVGTYTYNSSGIRPYKSNTYTGAYLYKINMATSKTPTFLSWSSAAYTATIGTSNTYPSLTKSPANLSGVTYHSSNTNAATIDSNGNITLIAVGETTITASYAGNSTYEAADDASYTLSIKASSTSPSIDDCDNPTWQLVTNVSDLAAGDEIVIAASTANYALSTTQRTSNRQAVAITKSDDAITINENVQVITLTTATNPQTNTFSFHVGTGFLYASSSSSNELKTAANPGQNGDWYLEIKNTGVASIIAQGDKTRDVMQFNLNNNNPAIFACYSSASQTSLAIYKKVCTTQPSVSFDLNGGSGTFEPEPLNGDSYTIPEAVPTRNGYNFVGWKIQGGDETIYKYGTINSTINNITESITLVAQWSAIEYTITYHLNGGSGVENSTYTIEYEDITLPTPTPAQQGLIFAGWYESADFTGNAVTVITHGSTGNKEFWAKWEKSTPTFAWSSATCTAALEADNTFPTLNNPNTLPVTYTSSNTDVATIDVNGNITLVTTGTTTITATGAETATHKSATTAYTLTVNPSNCRWVEVTDNTTLEDGDEVVITMTWGATTWALPNNGGTSTPEVVVVNNVDGDKMLSVSNDMIWTVDEGDGNYSFYPMGSNATWLYCTNNNEGVRVGTGENKYFTIVNGLASDSENNFLYNNATLRYVGVYHSGNDNPNWRCYKLTDKGAFPTNIKNQTLKFYKKTCLMSNEFWIDYELANVTCTNTPPPFASR